MLKSYTSVAELASMEAVAAMSALRAAGIGSATAGVGECGAASVRLYVASNADAVAGVVLRRGEC